MSDRGVCVLSIALLAAAAIIAFKPGPAASVPAASPPGSAIVQQIEFREGKKAILAVMPDGRYTLWRQFSSDDFYPPSHGTIGLRE